MVGIKVNQQSLRGFSRSNLMHRQGLPTGLPRRLRLLAMTITILLALCSCSRLSEDLHPAQDLAAHGHYEEAISLLDSYKSRSSKKYNSQLRLEYGEQILKDLDSDQQARYREAKTLFERALELDPKNTRARVLYLTVLKLIKEDDQA